MTSVSNNPNNISGNNTSQVPPSTQSYSISMNLSNPGNLVINSTANAVVSAPINTGTGTNTATNILEKTTEQGSKGSFKCGHCGQVSNWKHVIQVLLTNTSNNKFLKFGIY